MHVYTWEYTVCALAYSLCALVPIGTVPLAGGPTYTCCGVALPFASPLFDYVCSSSVFCLLVIVTLLFHIWLQPGSSRNRFALCLWQAVGTDYKALGLFVLNSVVPLVTYLEWRISVVLRLLGKRELRSSLFNGLYGCFLPFQAVLQVCPFRLKSSCTGWWYTWSNWMGVQMLFTHYDLVFHVAVEDPCFGQLSCDTCISMSPLCSWCQDEVRSNWRPLRATPIVTSTSLLCIF